MLLLLRKREVFDPDYTVSGMAGRHAFFNQSDNLLFIPVGRKGKVAADDRAKSGVYAILAGLADIIFPDLKITSRDNGCFKFFSANIAIQCFHVLLLQ